MSLHPTHPSSPGLILASTSTIRAGMLRQAGLAFVAHPARIDEIAVRQSLQAENTPPRDIADHLAELKARKISTRHPEALVIGSDQICDHNGKVISKPESPEEAREHLTQLSGTAHKLHSAAVLYHEARPLWRHVSTATLTMHSLSPSFIADYVERNWSSIQTSVGGYKIEEEGIRLFARLDGDHFTIQGMPLVPLLSYLAQRGTLPL